MNAKEKRVSLSLSVILAFAAALVLGAAFWEMPKNDNVFGIQQAFAVESPTSVNQADDVELQADMSRTVYCPKSGKGKYHYSATCSGMKSPRSMTLQQAVDAGYSPCSKCVHEAAVPDPKPAPDPAPDPTPEPAPQPLYRGFYDVPADAWYVTSGVFDYALDNGLMSGYGSGIFAPEDGVSRAMAATVLWRMAGKPACSASSFDDVDYGEWYGDAINWARNSGVVKGYAGSNDFGPNDKVTREQLAVMVANTANVVSGIDTSSSGNALSAKSDASAVSEWAYGAVAWCVDEEILGGAATIDPQGTATRCQGCKMFSIAFRIVSASNERSAKMQVHFIDVGQGDSEFIELPNGKTMLIDAGPEESGPDVVSYLRAQGCTRVDYLIASHPHEDHIGGMGDVLRSFDIGEVWMPRAQANTRVFEDFLDAIAAKGIPVHAAEAGKVIVEDSSFAVEILSPRESTYADLNDWSAIIEVDCGSASFLFSGDASANVIDAACNHHIDVLKVGHHGSKTSTNPSLVAKLSPTFAIISCGKNNSYGHPTKEALAALASVPSVYRTDEDGTVVLESDGSTIKRAA